MRLDRLLTLSFVRPFCGKNAGNALPILMYHSITDEPEAGVAPYYQTTTRPAIFRQHLRWLKNAGYRGASLEEGLQILRSERKNEKLAIITFDDGFRDFHTDAFPALQEHGFSATMFLPSSFIAEPRRSFRSRECMSWSEVRDLHRAGIQFGSHTVSHPKLVELAWPQVAAELRDSKSEIEQRLGAPCNTFAYPFAFPETNRDFVTRLSALLAETGYSCCATTRIGRAKPGDDLMQLKRLPANSCDDAKLFRAKLDGAYDWLASVQTGLKRIKSLTASPKQNCGCGCTGAQTRTGFQKN